MPSFRAVIPGCDHSAGHIIPPGGPLRGLRNPFRDRCLSDLPLDGAARGCFPDSIVSAYRHAQVQPVPWLLGVADAERRPAREILFAILCRFPAEDDQDRKSTRL